MPWCLLLNLNVNFIIKIIKFFLKRYEKSESYTILALDQFRKKKVTLRSIFSMQKFDVLNTKGMQMHDYIVSILDIIEN